MQFGDQRVAQDRTLQQSRCIGLRDLAVPGSVGLDGDHRTMPTLGEAARFDDANLVSESRSGHFLAQGIAGIERSLARTTSSMDADEHQFLVRASHRFYSSCKSRLMIVRYRPSSQNIGSITSH